MLIIGYINMYPCLQKTYCESLEENDIMLKNEKF